MKKRMKKGFTLAELLIVVAIIAVLTAIAVPLFVTSLNKAQTATDEANERAVRVAATYAILTAEMPESADEQGDEAVYTLETGADDVKSWALVGPWYVYAEISDDGQISNLKVGLAAKKAAVWGATLKEGVSKHTGGGFEVRVTVAKTDLTELGS